MPALTPKSALGSGRAGRLAMPTCDLGGFVASRCTRGMRRSVWIRGTGLSHLAAGAPSIRAAVARVGCPLVDAPGWMPHPPYRLDVRLGGCFGWSARTHAVRRPTPTALGRAGGSTGLYPSSQRHPSHRSSWALLHKPLKNKPKTRVITRGRSIVALMRSWATVITAREVAL